jgi:putative transposase
MSRYIRPHRPGASIFFTVTLAARGADTLVRHVDLLREAVRQTRADRPFGIDAWVVLPDHMHCVRRMPEGDADYAVRMGAIKARFSMALRRAGFPPPSRRGGVNHNGGVNPTLRKGEVGIWQRRFWEHHIRDEADWQAHVHYCWINPVKHGFVAEPWQWPHSSWNRDNP